MSKTFGHPSKERMSMHHLRKAHAYLITLASLTLWFVTPMLLPSQALAQDMSFDVEETDESNVETSDEEQPSDTEEGGSGEGSDDVISSLAESSDEEDTSALEPKAENIKESSEEIYAIQRIHVLRRNRFDISPTAGFTINDPYISHPSVGIRGRYWITNELAVGLSFLWYQGLESESDFNFFVRRSFRLAVPVTEYQFGAHANVSYVPFYGKFTMFNKFIFQWDAYFIGGVGTMRTRPIAVIDPDVRDFDYQFRVAFNFGIGFRVFVNRWFAVFAELRDYLYLEKFENSEVSLGDARLDSGTWLEDGFTPTNNVTLHLGVSFFIPFDFEYRLPK